jgi:hypothetical protein
MISVGSNYHTGDEVSTSIYFVVSIIFLDAPTTVSVLSAT